MCKLQLQIVGIVPHVKLYQIKRAPFSDYFQDPEHMIEVSKLSGMTKASESDITDNSNFK